MYPLKLDKINESVDFSTDYTGFELRNHELGYEESEAYHKLTKGTLLPFILKYADKDCPPKKR